MPYCQNITRFNYFLREFKKIGQCCRLVNEFSASGVFRRSGMILHRALFIASKIQLRRLSAQCQYPSIIKEFKKTVEPFSSIRISSSIPVTIQPYDLVECPSSNIFRATLVGRHIEKQKNAQMLIEIDGKNINVVNKFKGDTESPICVLSVPVKSDLKIEAEDSVEISEMYSDYINVEAVKNILTSNLRCTTIDLGSENGKIQCNGLILAHKINIHSENGVCIYRKR